MSTKYTAESLAVCRLADVAHLMNNLEAVAYKLQRERNVALEQRDALLAALQAIASAGADLCTVTYMQRIARAAIAACEVQS